MEEDEQNCLIVSNFPHSTQKMCCFGVYKLLSDIYKWHLAPKIVILRTFYRKLPLTIFEQPKILTSHWPVIDRSSQNSKFRSLLLAPYPPSSLFSPLCVRSLKTFFGHDWRKKSLHIPVPNVRSRTERRKAERIPMWTAPEWYPQSFEKSVKLE